MTPDKQTLSALIERAEGASRADRELDCALACRLDRFFPTLRLWPDAKRPDPMGPLVYGDMTYRVDFCTHNDAGGLSIPGHGGDQMVPEYTASLDAALALCERVLPGWLVMNLCEWEDEKLRAKGPWMAQLKQRGVFPTKPNEASCMNAPTPALALILAMLRALEASR